MNIAPINWYSLCQNTVECLTFGSEYVALYNTIEKSLAHNKLRMIGIPLEESANIFMDNESVVKSSMNSDTCLK